MPSLSRELRKKLEDAVKDARDIAEAGALTALKQLGVDARDAPKHLSAEQSALRKRLRARARQLGDPRDAKTGEQRIDHLIVECAYEHWHRMLFARFLGANDVLMHPSGVSVTLDECHELASSEGAAHGWELAGRYAARMLPQIFRPDEPVLQVALPPERQKLLEKLLNDMHPDTFLSNDALGWVYQFWQAKRKDEVNASQVKIGADELPAVTQLFTEDYMVQFLLHNTLGAWWAGKVLAAHPNIAADCRSEEAVRQECAVQGVTWTHLRFVRDGEPSRWRPAAGTFQVWPKASKDLRVMDPCMGSGHFLVAALPILVGFRSAEEELSPQAAITAVLRDNLFGLEVDPRCTQLAAFAVALAAWQLAGYQPLPRMHIACSGLCPNTRESDWLALAGDNAKLRRGMERIFRLFRDASILGSLINPRVTESDLLAAEYDELQPLLESALALESKDEVAHEMAITAQGLSKAAGLLADQFTLVATNVPYLGDRKQGAVLKGFCTETYRDAKANLATCFVERCLQFTAKGGTAALVTPQNWLLQDSYKRVRARLLRENLWRLIARLGPGAFETITGEVVDVVLLALANEAPPTVTQAWAIDVGSEPTPTAKGTALQVHSAMAVNQAEQLRNPDSRITLDAGSDVQLLESLALAPQGIITGDMDKWVRRFWELPALEDRWRAFLSTADATAEYSGRANVIDWSTGGGGMIRPRPGNLAVGKRGVAISQMGQMAATIYCGELYDGNIAPIVPIDPKLVGGLWAFCSSDAYEVAVRRIDRKVNLTNGSLLKVPFDADHWGREFARRYPKGLPQPSSSDPTQWLFNGHPSDSDRPLQVAVACLLGYKWPRQSGTSLPDCPSASDHELRPHEDADGIVCLPSVRGEEPAATRLNALLAAAFGPSWSPTILSALLASSGYSGKSLDDWLRHAFFEEHCDLFQQRPFVWHVWDGLKRGGFSALVNYHKLDRRLLETLTYNYLGDWLKRQNDGVSAGDDGAQERLDAAKDLQRRLECILEGESPYDIFVRWKPLDGQPIGWEPDLNDGVRLNIRPFVEAGVLRKNPKISWNKDRGKDVASAPWYEVFDGERINDHHLTLADKRTSRAAHAHKAAPAKRGGR